MIMMIVIIIDNKDKMMVNTVWIMIRNKIQSLTVELHTPPKNKFIYFSTYSEIILLSSREFFPFVYL